MPVKDRKRLRNQISALDSRVKRDKDEIKLKQNIQSKNDAIQNFINIIEPVFEQNEDH